MGIRGTVARVMVAISLGVLVGACGRPWKEPGTTRTSRAPEWDSVIEAVASSDLVVRGVATKVEQVRETPSSTPPTTHGTTLDPESKDNTGDAVWTSTVVHIDITSVLWSRTDAQPHDAAVAAGGEMMLAGGHPAPGPSRDFARASFHKGDRVLMFLAAVTPPELRNPQSVEYSVDAEQGAYIERNGRKSTGRLTNASGRDALIGEELARLTPEEVDAQVRDAGAEVASGHFDVQRYRAEREARWVSAGFAEPARVLTSGSDEGRAWALESAPRRGGGGDDGFCTALHFTDEVPKWSCVANTVAQQYLSKSKTGTLTYLSPRLHVVYGITQAGAGSLRIGPPGEAYAVVPTAPAPDRPDVRYFAVPVAMLGEVGAEIETCNADVCERAPASDFLGA